MKLRNTLSIACITALGLAAPSYASTSKIENTSKGVQITINYSAPDHLLVLGRIQININEVNFPDQELPMHMSLPAVNLGNHRLWEPFNFWSFDPWAITVPYYPFDVSQPTPFGSYDFYNAYTNLYASPVDAKILPPLDVPWANYVPGASAFIEIPSLGYLTDIRLPLGSVVKTGNHEYHVKFNTCDFDVYADECGVIDFTVKPDGMQSSTFEGTREDFFKSNMSDSNAHKKMLFKGKFKEHSAKVEGTVFGDDIFPGVNGVIMEFDLVNATKHVYPERD